MHAKGYDIHLVAAEQVIVLDQCGAGVAIALNLARTSAKCSYIIKYSSITSATLYGCLIKVWKYRETDFSTRFFFNLCDYCSVKTSGVCGEDGR